MAGGYHLKKIFIDYANCFKLFYLFFSFFSIDALIRIMTRWLGYYSIYKIVPTLFSVYWICIIIIVLSILPRKTGKIVYILLYIVLSIYSIIQYIYYLIFDKFLFFSDLQKASEGGEFLGYVINVIDETVIFYFFLLVIIGVIGVIFYPKFTIAKSMHKYWHKVLLMFFCVLGILFTPTLYKLDANDAMNASIEYESFTSSGFDLEIAGYYQFLVRDFWLSFLKPEPDVSTYISQIEEYFSDKQEHMENDYTGMLKGKNIIIVQMESIDDWIINNNVTPTIYKLMNEGINFTNMYTPCYGSGLTFGTEFAFNTGIYQGSTIMSGARLARNSFPFSIAHIFKNSGYVCNSFHENTGNYYNRNSMHEVMGYKYHCTSEIISNGDPRDDTTIVSDDNSWNLLTNKQRDGNFLDFIITYSAHLPYDSEDTLGKYALSKYPQYDVKSRNPEINVYYAKARLTDDMFSALIKRLQNEGELENTVIIAYTDHYSYGITDQEKVLEYSINNGNYILERTPAFIWYSGCKSVEIDKTCQTIDWLPTIANMLGIDVNSFVLGNDIFDENYEGYAFLPDNSWVSGTTYVKNGKIHSKGDMSKEEIEKMNNKLQDFYDANNAILRVNYYDMLEK